MLVGPSTDSVGREDSQGLFSMAKGHCGDKILVSAGVEVKCVQNIVLIFIF